MSFHHYPTRNCSNLRGNFCPRSKISESSIHFHPVNAWNKLPNELKSCKDDKVYKTKLRAYILSNDKFIASC